MWRSTSAERVRKWLDTSQPPMASWAAQECSPPRASLPAIILYMWHGAPQGGPGASALLGNFYELGPHLLTEDLELRENPGRYARSSLKHTTASCAACLKSKVPGASAHIWKEAQCPCCTVPAADVSAHLAVLGGGAPFLRGHPAYLCARLASLCQCGSSHMAGRGVSDRRPAPQPRGTSALRCCSSSSRSARASASQVPTPAQSPMHTAAEAICWRLHASGPGAAGLHGLPGAHAHVPCVQHANLCIP